MENETMTPVTKRRGRPAKDSTLNHETVVRLVLVQKGIEAAREALRDREAKLEVAYEQMTGVEKALYQQLIIQRVPSVPAAESVSRCPEGVRGAEKTSAPTKKSLDILKRPVVILEH